MGLFIASDDANAFFADNTVQLALRAVKIFACLAWFNLILLQVA